MSSLPCSQGEVIVLVKSPYYHFIHLFVLVFDFALCADRELAAVHYALLMRPEIVGVGEGQVAALANEQPLQRLKIVFL